MSNTLFENYYDAGYDGFIGIYGNTWGAQTFTTGTVSNNVPHYLTSIKLLLDSSTILLNNISYYYIRNTSSNLPITPNLSNGSIPAGTITTTEQLYEITITPPVLLRPSTKYAIIVSCPTATDLNQLQLWCLGMSPTYTGGNICVSTNGGSSWSTDSSKDAMFYEYGLPLKDLYMTTIRYGQTPSDVWGK